MDSNVRNARPLGCIESDRRTIELLELTTKRIQLIEASVRRLSFVALLLATGLVVLYAAS